VPHTRDLTDQGFSVMEAAGAADVRAVMSGLAGLGLRNCEPRNSFSVA
jgi:hypothetical protein